MMSSLIQGRSYRITQTLYTLVRGKFDAVIFIVAG